MYDSMPNMFTDSIDCGLYAIANAFDLCDGMDPSTCSWKGQEMRQHLMQCMGDEQIQTFPRHDQPHLSQGVTLTDKVRSYTVHAGCLIHESRRWPHVLNVGIGTTRTV